MRYLEFKIAESFVLTELSDKVKQLMRDKFKKSDPALDDQQLNFYLDRWDRYAASFPVGERDITRLTFNQVEQLIDAAEARAQIKGKTTAQPIDTNDDTIYDQNNLTILKGDMRAKCIQYGKGYSWCISRADASNLFYRYRFGSMSKEPVFYFVFDKDLPRSNPWHAVVIYVTKDNRYMVATAPNTGDVSLSWSQISAHNPKLSQLQSLFKPQPITPEERADYTKYNKTADDATYAAWSLDEKYKYIQHGRLLSPKQQSVTPKELIGIASKLNPIGITEQTWERLGPSDRKKVEQGQLSFVEAGGDGEGAHPLELIYYPTEAVQLYSVENDGDSIQYIDNPSDAVQLAAVQESGMSIKRIIQMGITPSEDVLQAAIKRDGRAIQYIKNPTLEMQLAAIQQTGLAIQYIENPSESVQLAAVKQDGRKIQYIDNPTPAVQLAAVQQYGQAIQYIKNPTTEMQLTAVQNDGFAIQYIENPSESVQLAAIQHNGHVIQYIKNPSLAVQSAAVQQYSQAIQYIKNPTLEMQLAAVQQTGLAISYIKNPSLAVQLAAVQNYGPAIQYIENPSDEIKWAALKHSLNSFNYIKDPTPEMQDYVERMRKR
jgi:hypothetical protein